MKTQEIVSATLPTSARDARKANVPYYRSQITCPSGHQNPIRLSSNRECRDCKNAYKRERRRELDQTGRSGMNPVCCLISTGPPTSVGA